MGLRDVAIPAELVKVSGDDGFIVRGLSPNDALQLYYRHAGQMSVIFDRFAGKIADADLGTDLEARDELFRAAAGAVSGTPQLMAEVIAMASGSRIETEDWESDVRIALTLPAGIQISALTKIATLTFSSDMPPGKFFGLVLDLAQSTLTALANQRA